MNEWEDDLAPTRRELDRDEYEDMMIRTYEGRFQEFCWAHHLDPEDTRSAVEYEAFWLEQHTSSN